jgi:uncharacterized protein
MAKISVTKPTRAQLAEASKWPIWTCEVSTFDYHYDEMETCHVLEGQVTVLAGDEKASFGPGDWVVFPQGMDCVWNVTAPVKKHYKFG